MRSCRIYRWRDLLSPFGQKNIVLATDQAGLSGPATLLSVLVVFHAEGHSLLDQEISTKRIALQPVWARLCWTGLGLRACGYNGMHRETFLHCYIALDYHALPTSTAEIPDTVTTYEFPDGNIFTIGAKRFRYAEVLFQPSFLPAESTSPLSRATWNATFASARICERQCCVVKRHEHVPRGF